MGKCHPKYGYFRATMIHQWNELAYFLRQAHHPKRNSPFSQKSAIKSILLKMSPEWSMNSSSIRQLSTKSIHQLSCLQLFYSSDDSTRNSYSSFIIMFPKSSICRYTSFSDRSIWLYMIISIIYIYTYIYIYMAQCLVVPPCPPR